MSHDQVAEPFHDLRREVGVQVVLEVGRVRDVRVEQRAREAALGVGEQHRELRACHPARPSRALGHLPRSRGRNSTARSSIPSASSDRMSSSYASRRPTPPSLFGCHPGTGSGPEGSCRTGRAPLRRGRPRGSGRRARRAGALRAPRPCRAGSSGSTSRNSSSPRRPSCR